MRNALHARHSLAMQFATFARSDVQTFCQLEQTKREMTGRVGDSAYIVGYWWMEGGVDVIDVSKTAVVHLGEAAPPSPRCFQRSGITPQSDENIQAIDTTSKDTKGIHQ